MGWITRTEGRLWYEVVRMGEEWIRPGAARAKARQKVRKTHCGAKVFKAFS